MNIFTEQIAQVRDFAHKIYHFGVFTDCFITVLAYNHLIHLVNTKLNQHPEVVRVPALVTLITEHLQNRFNCVNHVIHAATYKTDLLDMKIIGDLSDVRKWQDAGYFTRRTDQNYPSRLERWKAIYDNAFYEVRGPNGEAIQVKVLDEEGNAVTYESVVRARNKNYIISKVPFWYTLNYGTGGKGYPNHQGIGFYEEALIMWARFYPMYTAQVEKFMNIQMERLLDNATVFDNTDMINFLRKRRYIRDRVYVDLISLTSELYDYARKNL